MDPTLAAVIGGLVGGLFAAVVSGLVTLRAQTNQHSHELKAAREDRLQRRRESAYEKVLIQAYRVMSGSTEQNHSCSSPATVPRPSPRPMMS